MWLLWIHDMLGYGAWKRQKYMAGRREEVERIAAAVYPRLEEVCEGDSATMQQVINVIEKCRRER